LKDAVAIKTRRRRRTWYRRRLRLQRSLLAAIVGTLLVAACWQNAARYLSLPTLHAAQLLPDSFWMRGKGNVHKDLALMAARSVKPRKNLARMAGVYPYSVVPGGIKDPDDLRYAALRDYVVRRHYAHFDYSHAQLVRVSDAREVYLSYRVRDAVYWTRRKVRLHPGELLLTDGKITARARCGNQVSDTAKPEVSKEEPEEDVLDQPVAALEPGPSFPVRALLPPLDMPAGQPTPPQLFAGSFAFPYVPFGVPIPSGLCSANDHRVDGKCVPKRKPVLPEPSTMLLIGTGLAFIAWRYRSRATVLT
jgi:hypothetical protein